MLPGRLLDVGSTLCENDTVIAVTGVMVLGILLFMVNTERFLTLCGLFQGLAGAPHAGLHVCGHSPPGPATSCCGA